MQIANQNQAFLLKLSDALRPLSDPEAVRGEACRLLGEQLGADWVVYGLIDLTRDIVDIDRGYAPKGEPPVFGEQPLSSFSWTLPDYKAGVTIVEFDTRNSERVPASERPAIASIQMTALISVPLLKDSQLVGALAVSQTEPRAWTEAEVHLVESTAERIWDAIERARVESTLRESEARFRHMADAVPQIVWITDAEGRLQFFNKQWADYIGSPDMPQTAADVAHDYLHPDDEEATIDAFEAAQASGEVFEVEHRIRGKEGRYRWFLVRAEPQHNPVTNEIVRWFGTSTDIHERKMDENILGANEARLRLALEVGQLATWDWDIKSNHVDWSEKHYSMIGHAVGDVVPSSETWLSQVHPDDRPGTEAALLSARADGHDYVHEFRTLHPDGKIRWLLARGRFFYDEAGQPVRMIGVMDDVTDHREWERRLEVLVAELQHRTSNLIAVVQALSKKTLKESSTLEEFHARYLERLQAVARVQGLLSRLQGGKKISFDELLRSELAAHGVLEENSDHLSLDGPLDVRLRSSTVQTFALAIHELATNAVKHGAFSSSGGHLAVSWRVETDGADRKLRVNWLESGVSMQAADTDARRASYGRELIERALPHQLDAKTSYELGADGVRCTVVVPISGARLEEPDNA